MQLLLLLFVLMQGAMSGSAQGKWHKAEYEYNYIEAMLIIGFVSVALIFEVLWHELVRHSRQSYYFGYYHDERFPGPSRASHSQKSVGHRGHRKRLYEDLANRMGGEFMILGVLAFIIFVVNQANGFQSLAERFPTDDSPQSEWHLPRDGNDWLHMAELVHMKLFIGMVLYFVLILCLVRGAIRQIKKWEKLEMRLPHEREALQKPQPNMPQQLPLHADKDLSKHMLWREYFMTKLLKWRETHPKLFSEMIDGVEGIDEADEDKIRQQLQNRFSLGAYFALNLEYGVTDSIQVHHQTWCGVMLTMGIFAILHRRAKLHLAHALPFFLVVSIFLFICMYLCSRRQKREINGFVFKRSRGMAAHDEPTAPVVTKPSQAEENREEPSDDNRRFSLSFSSEQLVLRLMQAFLFLISYMFARVLADFHAWQGKALENTTWAAAFTVLFCILAKFVPTLVPTFLAVMSFPPFVDPVNLAMLNQVMLSQQEELSSAQSARGSDSSSKVSGTINSCCATNGRDNEHMVATELAEILGVRTEFEERLCLKQHLANNVGESI